MNKIGWCNESWNFLGGCSECSSGCAKCWACRQAAGRWLKDHPLYKGLAKDGHWTGEIRLCTDIGRADMLEKPLHWREPRRIFACDMGDLFHEKVPFEFIDKVFAVAALCPQHTFLILTKRPEIMGEYIEAKPAGDINISIIKGLEYFVGKKGKYKYCGQGRTKHLRKVEHLWPLPNVHLGVTVCNQAEADEKIPILLQIPAAHRFLCLEPLLEKVDLKKYLYVNIKYIKDKRTLKCNSLIDWIICGCESLGGRAGRFQEGYAKAALDIIQQCKAAGVKVWHKQMPIKGKVSKNPDEWPAEFSVQEST